ncbi:MAG: hypothetical protein ACLFWG_04635 [Longimicrobiales bacterium]
MGRGKGRVAARKRDRTRAVGHLEKAERLDQWVRSNPDGLVTRAMFVNALEVYHRKMVEENRWWRQLWRWIRREPVVKIDLFAALKVILEED